MAIEKLLEAEKENQAKHFPNLQIFVNTWFELKDDEELEDNAVIEKFDAFVCSQMEQHNLK